MRHYRRLTVVFVPLLFSLSSCNLFELIDSPSGDNQLVSAARACFDQGDFECAFNYLSEISNAGADVRESERAFVELAQLDMTMRNFMVACGTGGGGPCITQLANIQGPNAGQTRRVAIYETYKRVANIQNGPMRGLVRFLAGLSLAAATLAETGPNQLTGNLDKLDLVDVPATCEAATSGTCATAVCNKTGASITAAVSLDLVANPTTSNLTGAPTYGMVSGALAAVDHALSNELEAGGKFQSGAGSNTSAILTQSSANYNCFSWSLITNGVGG